MPSSAGTLHVFHNSKLVRKVPLDTPVVTIGRGPENMLVLELQPTSRRHAEVRVEDRDVLITDKGSSYGTFVNGKKLASDQPHRLDPGAEIQIGPYVIVYEAIGQTVEPDGDAPFVTQVVVLSGEPPASPAAGDGSAPMPAAHLTRPRAAPRPYAPDLPEATRTGRYLRYLPLIFHDNDFLSRYLQIFESIWEPLERRQDHIDMYFDPRTSPEPFLSWLAVWLGIAMNRHWPELRRRQLLAASVELYHSRGTRYGLSRMIEICTGLTPEITDLAKSSEGGKPQPFVFRVRLTIPPGSDVDRAFVEELVRAHKPAHAGYILETSS